MFGFMSSLLGMALALASPASNAITVANTIDPGGSYTTTLMASDAYEEYDGDITVHYDLNGGSGSLPDTIVHNDGTMTFPDDLSGITMDGYYISGWSSSITGESFAAGATTDHEQLSKMQNDGRVTFIAQWEKGATKVPMILELEYDDVSSTITDYYDKGNVTAPENPFGDRTGYDFTGWNTESDGTGISYAVGDSIDSTTTVVLYAQWTRKTAAECADGDQVVVSFDANGGTGSMASQNASAECSYTVPDPSYTRDGYTFKYWSTLRNGDGAAFRAGASTVMTDDITLYAIWDKDTVVDTDKYQVLFDSNGSATGSMDSITVASGESITVPQNGFTRSGYEFTGWNTRSDGTGTSYAAGDSYTPESDGAILYAQWRLVDSTKATFTVTLNPNGGSGGAILVGGTSDGVTLYDKSITRSGYTISSWTMTADGKGDSYADKSTIHPTSDITLYAQWTKTGTGKDNESTTGTGTSDGDSSTTDGDNSSSSTNGDTSSSSATDGNGTTTDTGTTASSSTNNDAIREKVASTGATILPAIIIVIIFLTLGVMIILKKRHKIKISHIPHTRSDD